MSLRESFWSSNPLWSGLRTWLVPRLFRVAHCALMSTVRVSTTGLHRLTPYLEGQDEGGAVLVIWHDQTLFPLHIFQDKGIVTLMSTSRNGSLFAQVWALYGWRIVWGSAKKRQGVLALREMLNRLRAGGIIGFTPDGPQGPRHQAHGGVVYLASKAPAPVLPFAYSASRAWNLPTWDKYIIPKPFSRVHLHIGAPFQVPPDLSREETAQWQQEVADALDEAERVAQSEVRARA